MITQRLFLQIRSNHIEYKKNRGKSTKQTNKTKQFFLKKFKKKTIQKQKQKQNKNKQTNKKAKTKAKTKQTNKQNKTKTNNQSYVEVPILCEPRRWRVFLATLRPK
jgi:hypothetical protein